MSADKNTENLFPPLYPWNQMNKLFTCENSDDVNLEDFQKKIGELKAIEKWLELNLSSLQTTIQALEVQLNTLNTLKEFSKSKDKNFQKELNKKISELTFSTANTWWSQVEKNMNIVLNEISNQNQGSAGTDKVQKQTKERKNRRTGSSETNKSSKKV